MSPRQETGAHHRRRLAMILLAAALLMAAGALWYGLRMGHDHSVRDLTANIKVHCNRCEQTFDMRFDEYQRRSPYGTDVSGPIDCPRCGGRACLVRAETSLSKSRRSADGKPPATPPERDAQAESETGPKDKPIHLQLE